MCALQGAPESDTLIVPCVWSHPPDMTVSDRIWPQRAAVKADDPCADCAVRPLSLCSALEDDELVCLAEIVQPQRIEPAHTIISEGEPALGMYNVTSGAVKLYKLMPDGRRQITGFLFAGDFLGLAMNNSYAYSAEAILPTTLCRLPRRQMDRLLEDFPKLQRRLFGMASNELASAQDQMLLLGRKSAKEKIASFLLTLSGRAQRRGQPANPVHLPMSRSDIADFIGLTTETVSRTFTQLKGSGIIRLLDGGRVELVDCEALAELAEGL